MGRCEVAVASLTRVQHDIEAESKNFSPVYIECKFYIACVRLGHDACDFVELLALEAACHTSRRSWHWNTMKKRVERDTRGKRKGGGRGGECTRSSMPVTLNMSSYLQVAVNGIMTCVSQCVRTRERAPLKRK